MTVRPSHLPNTWLSKGRFNGALVFDRVDGRRALYAIEEHHDGRWEHLSISRPDQIPSWDDLRQAKLDFFGPRVAVAQIIPSEKNYVNKHPYCLHLWRYLGGKRWPIEE